MKNILLPSGSFPFSLDLCLRSGQSFAWRNDYGFWFGSIRKTGFAIRQAEGGMEYMVSKTTESPSPLLKHYFAIDEDHRAILEQFPSDPILCAAIQFCAGLRVLRQDPWECLAGFILSSAKQIVHIEQIWQKISRRWGAPLKISLDHFTLGGEGDGDFAKWPQLYSFPDPQTIANLSESDLRKYSLGFRSPYLLAAAREIASGKLSLESLQKTATQEARKRLMILNGVGQKIADCVLLFSLGKSDAFPVDTWILKVLRYLYFHNKRKITPKKLRDFADSYFGVYGGYAQQYLFHYVRMNPQLFKNR